jgi:hypothetical protein
MRTIPLVSNTSGILDRWLTNCLYLFQEMSIQGSSWRGGNQFMQCLVFQLLARCSNHFHFGSWLSHWLFSSLKTLAENSDSSTTLVQGSTVGSLFSSLQLLTPSCLCQSTVWSNMVNLFVWNVYVVIETSYDDSIYCVMHLGHWTPTVTFRLSVVELSSGSNMCFLWYLEISTS